MEEDGLHRPSVVRREVGHGPGGGLVWHLVSGGGRLPCWAGNWMESTPSGGEPQWRADPRSAADSSSAASWVRDGAGHQLHHQRSRLTRGQPASGDTSSRRTPPAHVDGLPPSLAGSLLPSRPAQTLLGSPGILPLCPRTPPPAPAARRGCGPSTGSCAPSHTSGAGGLRWTGSLRATWALGQRQVPRGGVEASQTSGRAPCHLPGWNQEAQSSQGQRCKCRQSVRPAGLHPTCGGHAAPVAAATNNNGSGQQRNSRR